MSDYYMDAGLGPGAKARLKRHVGECDECRRLLAGLREMIRVLGGLPTPSGVGAGRHAASVRLRLDEPGRS
jgi:anti-sigma factor RsiW